MAGAEHTAWVMQAVDAYEARLLRYAADLVGTSAARDVVQDTFLRLCDQDRAKVADHLAAWLFTVCRRRGLELRRNRKPELDLDGARLSSELPAADVAYLHAEQRSLVRDVLRGLPERERELVRLRFDADLSYKEIAAVTGLSVTNVGFLLHTAVRTLRDALAQRDEAPSRGARRPR